MSFQSFVLWTCDVCYNPIKTNSFELPSGWARFSKAPDKLTVKHKCEMCQRRERRSDGGGE